MIAVDTDGPLYQGFKVPEASTFNLCKSAVVGIDISYPKTDVQKAPPFGAGRPVAITATLSVL